MRPCAGSAGMLLRGSSAAPPNPNHDRLVVVLTSFVPALDPPASSILVLYTLYTPRFPRYSSGTGHDDSDDDAPAFESSRARSYAARPPSHGGGAPASETTGADDDAPMIRARGKVRGCEIFLLSITCTVRDDDATRDDGGCTPRHTFCFLNLPLARPPSRRFALRPMFPAFCS